MSIKFSHLTGLSGFGSGTIALPGDPDFASVVLLVMNGDGTDGNTDMVDKSAAARTITWGNQAQVDTGIEKFSGEATLLLDGVNDYIRVPDHADFSLGTQDFTFEAWVYPTSTGTNQAMLTQYNASGDQRAWRFNRLSDGTLHLWTSSAGATVEFQLVSTGTIPQDAWTWVVVQREGDDFTMWIGGTRDAAPTTDTIAIRNSNDPIYSGIRQGASDDWAGNLGPMRFTVGVARYSGAPASIDVPTGPYPEF